MRIELLACHGRMSLADVLQPATRTAEEGYLVSELLACGWQTQVRKLLRTPDWKSGDCDNGPEQPSGHKLLVDLGAMPPVARLHVTIECMRSGYADAQQWVCDPYVAPVPPAVRTCAVRRPSEAAPHASCPVASRWPVPIRSISAWSTRR